MTTPHPQADLLRAIADGKQMQELDFPGINHPGNWCDCDADRALNLIIRGVEQYVRIKPETVTINDTVTINGIECNAPMRVAPALQTIYFKPDPDWKKCMTDACGQVAPLITVVFRWASASPPPMTLQQPRGQ